MTAFDTLSPRYVSAASLSLPRIMAEISCGEKLPPAAATFTRSPALSMRYGTWRVSSRTSSGRRPMKRLIECTVAAGFVTAWRLAVSPTRRSLPLVNATTEGVVRVPSWFGTTLAWPACITATTEFVVPRSIPITLPILFSPCLIRSALVFRRTRLRCPSGLLS